MIPFILGVTGHRNLPADDLPRIEGAVREQLLKLRYALPDTRIIVASAQAEGADRLVTRVALALNEGFEVWSILPTDANEYEKDFTSEQSRAEFRDLLKKSVRILNASALAGHDVELSKRPQIYVCGGNEICRLSHALLAVWDGKSSDRPGGTADVVTAFLSGRFEDAAAKGLTFPDCGFVYQVPIEIEGVTSAEKKHESPLPPRLEDGGKPILRGGEGKLLSRLAEGMRSLNRFNRCCREAGQIHGDGDSTYLLPGGFAWRKDAVLGSWLSLYTAADFFSSRAMNRRHRALIAVVILFALSMMSSLLYGGLVTGGYWPLLLGIGLMAAAYLVYVLHKRSGDHETWIGNRALAEFLRVAISWRACGVKEPIHHVLADEQVLPMDWLGMAARWLDNESRITVAAGAKEHDVKVVADHWIGGQIDYFADKHNKIDHHGSRAKWLERMSLIFIGLAMGADVITMILDHLLSAQGRDEAFHVTHWVLYAYWALLGLSAVVAAYSGIMAHAEHELEYSHALIKFRLARAALSETSDARIRYDVLVRLGKSAARETAGLFRLHLGRPLRLPF